MLRYLLFTLVRRKWFFISLLIMFSIYLLPPPDGLGKEGLAVIGITLMAIILFVSAAIPLPATALLIAFFQVLFRVGSPNQVARTFTGDAMFFIMGILLISNVLIKQKIDRRLSGILIKFTGYSVAKLALGIMILCSFLSAIIGEHSAAALLFPAVLSIIALEKYEHPGKDQLAKLLLFALAFSSMVGGMATPSGGGRNPLMMEYLWRLGGVKVTYVQWVIMVMPVAIILIPVLYFIIKFTFRTDIKGLPRMKILNRTIRLQIRQQISSRVMRSLSILIFTFILFLWIFFSEPLGMGLIALFGVLLYILTGLARWSDISSKTNWGIILIYGSSLSLGLAMKFTGVTSWFANGISDLLYQCNISQKPIIVGAVATMSALISDVLSHGPSVAVSAPIFIKLAEVGRMNVLIVGLINVMAASFGFLTIIAAPTNSLIYTSGYIKTVDYLKVGWSCTIAAVLVTVIFSLFYWNIIGYVL